jgi:hypothetical protein
LQTHPYLYEHRQCLPTIPGIDPKNVLPLLVLLLRWHTRTDGQGHAEGLTAWVGIDPKPWTSGTSVFHPPTISKMGNREIRRLLWNASMFGAPSGDLDRGYAAWQAWGQQNVERLPGPLRAGVELVNQPGVQDALLATMRVPAGNQLTARAARGTGRAYSRLTGHGIYVLFEPNTNKDM